MKLWLKNWQLPTLIVIVSRHMSLRDYSAEKKYLCLTLDLITLFITSVTGILGIFYIQSWKLLHRKVSLAVAI
jgi:hypothetical protein